MPTLNWIGKDKVINHHLDVPYRVLNKEYTFNAEDSENKIIHGDNLEALKALLPEYEGKIKCIYIDPPYNTGNEGWVYNDNVNDPKIKKWLGEVVGKESEDLTRHDKWLCMMYPRLKLLHKLLAKEGVIFISIDDNEYHHLKSMMDDIYSVKNHITTFTWRTDGNFDNQAKIKINHEYILCYSKDVGFFNFPEVIDPNVEETSKLFKKEIVNTIVKNGNKNPVSKITLPIGFPANFNNGKIEARVDQYPFFKDDAIIKDGKLINSVEIESGWSSKNIFELFLNNGLNSVLDTKGQLTTFYITENGAIESSKKREVNSHVISSLMNMGSTQNMSNELLSMGFNFDFPKPVFLIKYLLSIATTSDSIILDSFAGSGTTAHAVLNLNKEDGGNRKFILVEMEEYAESITAERVKRVINGYGEGKKKVDGTGGDFNYYELGLPIFKEEFLNEELSIEEIRKYIWYSETKEKYVQQDFENPYLVGINNEASYYFLYEKDKLTTLNMDFLNSITIKSSTYVIYADNCVLPKEFLTKNNIIFKKTPRDISRF